MYLASIWVEEMPYSLSSLVEVEMWMVVTMWGSCTWHWRFTANQGLWSGSHRLLQSLNLIA